METLFKLQYLYFTQPRKDRSIFEKVIDDQKNQVKHLTDSPRMVFYDSLYRSQFQNPAGFNIFLVGNIDTTKLKLLVEKYLASLPMTEAPLNWKNISPGFPEGKTNVVVHKGSAPKSTVMMMMKGKYKYDFENNLLMDALTLKKVKETFIRTRQSDARKNPFWLNQIIGT